MNENISPRHLMNLHRLMRLSGWLNIALGIIILLAWFLDWQRVKSIAPGLPAMTPNTAVSLVLLGAVLAFLIDREQGHLRRTTTVSIGLALFFLGISALVGLRAQSWS
jgi:hypothetical protein